MLYISRINIYIYIYCSIRICSVFDHFGYRVPDLSAWNHLTWYSEDRTLQWLQALRAEMNPHHIRGHEFCHREEDQSTLAITRAIMDRVGATITTQVVATSTTSSAPGTSTTPLPPSWLPLGRVSQPPTNSLLLTAMLTLMAYLKFSQKMRQHHPSPLINLPCPN